MKRIILALVAMMLSGCMPTLASYQFSPYINADGTKGMQDTYAGLTEDMANQSLGATLGKSGLCPAGWYIEKSWPSPIYAPVTVREVKCR